MGKLIMVKTYLLDALVFASPGVAGVAFGIYLGQPILIAMAIAFFAIYAVITLLRSGMLK